MSGRIRRGGGSARHYLELKRDGVRRQLLFQDILSDAEMLCTGGVIVGERCVGLARRGRRLGDERQGMESMFECQLAEGTHGFHLEITKNRRPLQHASSEEELYPAWNSCTVWSEDSSVAQVKYAPKSNHATDRSSRAHRRAALR